MTLYLHKFLPWLFLPTGLLLCFLLLGVITRRRFWAVLALLLAWLGCTPAVSDVLMRWCEEGATRQAAANMPQADAIVVLSEGRLTAPGGEKTSEWFDGDRFWGGMALYQAHKAPKLVFTGGWVPWVPDAPLEGSVLRTWAMAQGVRAQDVVTTGRVSTTEEEAAAVAKLLPRAASSAGAGKKASVLLVTSAYHMPRASLLFEQAGFQVIRYPVDFQVDAAQVNHPWRWMPQARYWSHTETAWRELLGRAYYTLN